MVASLSFCYISVIVLLVTNFEHAVGNFYNICTEEHIFDKRTRLNTATCDIQKLNEDINFSCFGYMHEQIRYMLKFYVNALHWGVQKIGKSNFVCVEMSDLHAKAQMSDFDNRYLFNDVEVNFHFRPINDRLFYSPVECDFCDLHSEHNYSETKDLRIVVDETKFISIEQGKYWSPKFDTDLMFLSDVFMFGIQRVSNNILEDCRYKTINIIKNWRQDLLDYINSVSIRTINITYLTTDDFACMPNLREIDVLACNLLFFSGLSVNNPSKNYFVEFNSAEYLKNIEHFTWYESYGINQKNIQALINEIGLFKNSVNSSDQYWQDMDKYLMKKSPVSTFPKLESINIIGNNLSENTFIFNASIFPNLKFVNLMFNNFKQIPITESIKGTKFYAINLTYLLLSQNQINSLKNIGRLGDLEVLNLYANKITSWNSSDVFVSKHHHISNVNLQNNLISKLSPVMRESLTVDSNVSIENNPFDCDDCSLPDIQTWIKEKKKSYDMLLCAAPTSLRDTPILEVNFDIEKCLPPKDFTWLVYPIFAPLIVFSIILSVFIYINRFRITYMLHLIQMRRNFIQNNDEVDRIWQYDAFVSYSKNDEEWVNRYLLPELEDEAKYKFCLQDRDIKIGAFVLNNIEENILCSRHAILVISPNFVTNNMCQWELKLIQQSFDLSPSFLILIELERLTHKDLPTNLRLLMGTRTYLEWSGQDESRFWERLKQALGPPFHTSQSESTQDFPREQQKGPTEEELRQMFDENVRIALNELSN